jgi:RNA polymerase sigma factor (sigma-70 family)
MVFIYSKMTDRDIADDVFQDTFIKVIKTLKSNSYNEEGKFLPWVLRIAHNLIVDHYRKNKKMPMLRETINAAIQLFFYVSMWFFLWLFISAPIQTLSSKIILKIPIQQIINFYFFSEKRFLIPFTFLHLPNNEKQFAKYKLVAYF